MYDVLTLAALTDELGEVANGRIQKVGLIDRLTFGAEIYTPGRRRWLIASADASAARIHLTDTPPSLDPELITPFGLLLRKYVRGAILIGAEQEPLERVIRLSIAKRLPPLNAKGKRAGERDDAELATGAKPDPFEPDPMDERSDEDVLDELDREDITYLQLVVEIMGRHSNILLLDDDGVIMDAVKHVSPAMSRVRPISPRRPWVAPPPMDRPDPRRLTADAAAEIVATARPKDELARVLVSRLRAVSPQIAREAVFRATGDAATTAGTPEVDPAAIARELRGLYEPLLTGTWAPAYYRERAEMDDLDDAGPAEEGAVVAFSPFPLHSLAGTTEEVRVASISEAAAAADGAMAEQAPVSHSQRRERLLAALKAARDRVDARLASIEAQELRARDAERLREHGELIYAYLWQIQPGDTVLEVDGQRIELDPDLSGKDNAAAYFQRYRKAQGAGRQLPELAEEAQRQLDYLDQTATMVRQASGFADIEALQAEWDAISEQFGTRPPQGKGSRRTSARADRRPRALYDPEGHAIYIGRSGRQNDTVTFDVAGADDTWLHARGVPGSHVIIKWRVPMPEEDERTVELAAQLAAWYSGSRNSNSVEVDVTRRRHVRKIRGAGPGLVTYRQERTIAVPPRDEQALRQELTPSSR